MGNILASSLRRQLLKDEAPDGCDPAYCHLINPARSVESLARRRCQEMWELFRPLADPNFLDEIPFKFHQRWFEMYLVLTAV